MQKLSSCSSGVLKEKNLCNSKTLRLDLSGQHFDHDSHSMDCDPVVAKQNVCQMKLPNKHIIL
jgi:hypothetical protein